MPKRQDYISWDEYFMGVAMLASRRSKDPGTQVGACIVNEDNKIMSVGYNGFPKGCSDDEFPWERKADIETDTKYPYVCHAELNAILNSGGNSLSGCRIYVALFPCNECAKAIIQAGIKEVIYISNKYKDTELVKASKRMLECVGVKLTQFNSDKQIVIDFNKKRI
ncbi:MAG: dCMP deaminase family protein [Clostridiales bacterium]|nr:dCMP deaminase family protein [Clostridiales bacterium]